MIEPVSVISPSDLPPQCRDLPEGVILAACLKLHHDRRSLASDAQSHATLFLVAIGALVCIVSTTVLVTYILFALHRIHGRAHQYGEVDEEEEDQLDCGCEGYGYTDIERGIILPILNERDTCAGLS